MRKMMTIGAALMVGVAMMVGVAGAQLKEVRDGVAPHTKPALELRTTAGTLQHDVVLQSTRRVEAALEGSFVPAPYVD